MRMLRAALITLALLMIPTSVAALSMPSQLGSLMSFPAITSGFDPTNTFSSGLAEYSPGRKYSFGGHIVRVSFN